MKLKLSLLQRINFRLTHFVRSYILIVFRIPFATNHVHRRGLKVSEPCHMHNSILLNKILMIFNENKVESDLKQHGDIDTFHIKIIRFSIGKTKIPKKNRLAEAPPHRESP